MRYCDTSLIIALLTNERHTAAVTTWFEQQENGITASPWTSVEVASALAFKARLGTIDEDALRRARSNWQTLIRSSVTMLELGTAQFDGTRDLYDLPGFSLRAGDALHVGIARSYGLTIATLDHRMAREARAIGLTVADILPN